MINDLEFLKHELAVLEDKKIHIENEIIDIKENILKLQNRLYIDGIKYKKENKELFIYYMMENRSLSEKSASQYIESLTTMRKLMEEYLNVVTDDEFFYIDNIDAFDKIRDLFNDSTELRQINLRRHHIISAAYNNYYNFLVEMKEI